MNTLISFVVLCTPIYLCMGILIHPPGRTSMWRFGYDTATYYNDEQPCYAGLLASKKETNQICDLCEENENYEPTAIKEPAIITENYISGEEILVKFNVTENVGGFSEFRVCDVDGLDASQETLQQCLDRHVLHHSGNKQQSRYYVPLASQPELQVRLGLPPGLSCRRCVLQWTHTGGKEYGICSNGSKTRKCRKQLTFRACADVSIKSLIRNAETMTENANKYLGNLQSMPLPKMGVFTKSEMTEKLHKIETSKDITTSIKVPNDNEKKSLIEENGVVPVKETWLNDNHIAMVPKDPDHKMQRMRRSGVKNCEPTSTFAAIPGAKQWCQNNCNHKPPFCPEDHCLCSGASELQCFPTAFFSAFNGAKEWCQANCDRIPRYCPPSHCFCDKDIVPTTVVTTTTTTIPTTKTTTTTTTTPIFVKTTTIQT